jgi:hypothetical protein
MENLSHYQERVLNQLYGPVGKTDPLKELVRICKFYDECLKEDNDKLLKLRFTELVESKLSFLLNQDYRFQELSEYKEDHLPRVKNYIEDYYEKSSWDGVDGIKELTKDYLKDCISEQSKILQKAFIFNISIPDSVPINAMQFVSEDFYKEYIPSSRRKMDFLNDQLKEINGFKSEISNNPYPLLFVSAEVYNKFIEYKTNHIIDFYIDFSYLKKRLELEKLIHQTKDNDFMKILFEEMKFISEKQYDNYLMKNKLLSLNKSSSASRENNFNNIFLD